MPGSLGQFLGTLQSFTQAVYAYASIESFTVIAAETQNPRRNIPKAAKRIVARVMFLFGEFCRRTYALTWLIKYSIHHLYDRNSRPIQ